MLSCWPALNLRAPGRKTRSCSPRSKAAAAGLAREHRRNVKRAKDAGEKSFVFKGVRAMPGIEMKP